MHKSETHRCATCGHHSQLAMKTYTVSGEVTVSCWTTDIKADSPEEAIKIAEEREMGNLVHNAFDALTDEVFHADTDGAPRKLKATEQQ